MAKILQTEKQKKPKTEFALVRLQLTTKIRIEQMKAIGQSVDGFIQELMNHKVKETK